MQNRVLIVDDKEIIRSAIAGQLEKEGYLCVTANDGKEALQQFHKENFSVVISEIKMPEMDGLVLLKNVKAKDPNIVVILMADYEDIDLDAEAIRLGAFDVVKKPIDLKQLVLTVKKGLVKNRFEEVITEYILHLKKLEEERSAELRLALLALKKAHLDTVNVLVRAIDAKDPYTLNHSDRVRKMSVRMGMKLGLSEKMLETLEYGALLHDIGMIGIKDEVLEKQSPLSSEEYQHIMEHPMIGVEILKEVSFFNDKLPLIRHHHEHFDGSGYPYGLTGESIPLGARIILVADAFDAMTSARRHRGAKSLEDALGELEKGKGKQFDPNIVEIFLREKIYKLPEAP
jgi:response regulator RpfG family c-di-GMP phosphodiesterase